MHRLDDSRPSFGGAGQVHSTRRGAGLFAPPHNEKRIEQEAHRVLRDHHADGFRTVSGEGTEPCEVPAYLLNRLGIFPPVAQRKHVRLAVSNVAYRDIAVLGGCGKVSSFLGGFMPDA
jgi:hypothetical protein